MEPLGHARRRADRLVVGATEVGDQHRVVDRRGDRRRGRTAGLPARSIDGVGRVDVEVRADPARHARGRDGEGVGSGVCSDRPGDLPVRRQGEILPVVGGVEDQRPARRRVDRWWSAAHAGAVVSGDRRHHDIVGLRGGGPADAERRGAAGGAAAGAHGAAEPDDEGSRTGLLHVALVRCWSADGARVAGRMPAGSARAVAGVGGAGVAIVRAGGTRVAGGMRARRARAAAHVGGAGVAVVRAGRGARLEEVGRTGGAGAGTSLGHVTLVGCRGAHRARGQEAVGRAGRARARAGLGDVARTRYRATRRARVPRRVLAGVARTVALIQGAGVGVGGAGRPERLLDVGGAGGARAGAGVGKITLPGGHAAGRARVARRVLAGGAGAVALVQGAGVAVVRACRAGVAHRVLAGVAGAVALVQGAGIAVVGAGYPARLLDVGGSAGGTGAGAGLGKITLAGGGAADRARVARGVLAGGAGAAALVQGAGVTIVRAGGACVGEAAVHLAAGGVSVCRAQVTLLSRFDNPVAARSGRIGERHLRPPTVGAPAGGRRER